MAAATLPAPSTYASGPVLVPQLRGDVADAVAWLSAPPAFTGSQTTSAQSVPSGADTSVNLDTEQYDNYGGHRQNASKDTYYAMEPGWYLCEASAPLNYSGGAGTLSAGVGGRQGGTTGVFYGMCAPMNSGAPTGVSGARLMQMVNAGTYGGGGNDYIQLYVSQTSGGGQPLLNTASQYPQLSATWVSALTGTAGLPVPPLAAWPAPPSYVTSAFLNAQIRDSIGFLIYPPIMEWSWTGSSQSISSQSTVPAVGQVVNLGTDTVDNYGAYDGSSTWTAPAAGCYYAYGQVSLATGVNSVALAAGLTVHSAHYNSGTAATLWGGAIAAVAAASATSSAIVRRRLRLNAGDTVKLAGFQFNSGGATAQVLGTGEWTSKLVLVWRSA